MSNIQNWDDWTDEAVEEQEQRIKNQRSDGDWFKLDKGDNYLRFLPPLKGQKTPFVEVWQHFVGGNDWPGKIPGREEGKPLVFECANMMHGDHCTACERRVELEKSRSKDDREIAYQLKPSMRVFANVVDMENPDAGVQIFAFPPTIYDGLMEIRNNKRMGGNFTHPESGRVICVTKKGEGKRGTRYSVKAGDREELEDWGWIEQQHDLTEPVPGLTDEDEVVLIGAIEAVESGGGGSTQRALPRQRRRRVEGPARKSRRRSSASEPEEGADVVDLDDEPPKRGKKRAERAKRGFVPRSRAQDSIDEDEDY